MALKGLFMAHDHDNVFVERETTAAEREMFPPGLDLIQVRSPPKKRQDGDDEHEKKVPEKANNVAVVIEEQP